MLLKFSKFFTYASLFAVLIVLTSAFFPFIGGKTYFFRVSIELALAFALLWWAFEAERGEAKARIKKAFERPLVVAVSVFVLMFLLASIFAHDPNAAFWSNYERGEGGFQMLHYYAFFMLLALFFTEKRDWEKMFLVAAIAALFMVAYGIGSAILIKTPEGVYTNPLRLVSIYVNPEGELVSPNLLGRVFSPEVRFQGSLGNPAYVSTYLLFAIFFCFYSAVRSARKWIWNAAAVFFFAFLILTQTRTAFIGLAVALIIFLIFLVLRGAGKLRKASFIALMALILFNFGMFTFRESSFVKSIPFANRFYNIGSIESFSTRVWAWGSAWKGFSERPLLGWGPENFATVFDRHFNPKFFVPGEQTETWFDRAHSVVFDYLAETGLLGFLSHLSIFIVFLIQFIKLEFRGGGVFSPTARALVFATAIAYLVQALGIFDVLPIYISLFLFFAFVSWWFQSSHIDTSHNGTHTLHS